MVLHSFRSKIRERILSQDYLLNMEHIKIYSTESITAQKSPSELRRDFRKLRKRRSTFINVEGLHSKSLLVSLKGSLDSPCPSSDCPRTLRVFQCILGVQYKICMEKVPEKKDTKRADYVLTSIEALKGRVQRTHVSKSN